ncbi:MAG TPA: OB-fold domain-containing protein [Pedomonas sp.]|uniref:Zn-ribbon domain-containing OB-fold protein n=1 Tax=Pedomonas sp. TaxID=2976421 RepID=UPI002F4162FE
MIDTIPIPDTSEPTEAPFWTALGQGRLVIQHCSACRSWLFPMRLRCPSCGQTPEWQAVSGRGRIWSFTRVHPPVLPAFAALAPYPVVVVELEEQQGLRLVGNLVEKADDPINVVAPDRITIGAPVEAVIRKIDGVPWPAWRIAG